MKYQQRNRIQKEEPKGNLELKNIITKNIKTPQNLTFWIQQQNRDDKGRSQ